MEIKSNNFLKIEKPRKNLRKTWLLIGFCRSLIGLINALFPEVVFPNCWPLDAGFAHF